jgi:tetratricopeptide (TPR) repeat protein
VAGAHAEIGQTYIDQGRFIDAEGSLREATRLNPKLGSAHQALSTVRFRRDASEIEAKLQEAIRQQPSSAPRHFSYGTFLVQLGKLPEGINALQEGLRLNPEEAPARRHLAVAWARRGEWQKAAQDFALALDHSDKNDHWHWYQLIPLRLASDDVAGYRRACQEMLERFGRTDKPEIAERIAKAFLLAPAAHDDLGPAMKLSEKAITGTEKHFQYRYFVLTRALADYRAGRFADACKRIAAFAPRADRFGRTAVSNAVFDSQAFAVLAMAKHRLGQPGEARAAMLSARAIVTRFMPAPKAGRNFDINWHDWLHCQALYQEADKLMAGSQKQSSAAK